MRTLTFTLALMLTGITAHASTHKIHPSKTFLPHKTITATVTAYTPAPRENLGRGRKSGTAIGTPIRPGIVAVSRDLLKSGWNYGDRVHIKGLGVFIIEDTMHERFRRTIDVAVPNVSAAQKIGVLRKIEVTLLEQAQRPEG